MRRMEAAAAPVRLPEAEADLQEAAVPVHPQEVEALLTEAVPRLPEKALPLVSAVFAGAWVIVNIV